MLQEPAIGAGAGCSPFGGVTTRARRQAAGWYPNGLRNEGDGNGAPPHSGNKTVLARFVAAARRLLGGASCLAAHGNPTGTQVPTETTGPLEIPGQEASRKPAFPYDEALLERSRTQWRFGDRPSLATLTRNTLQHHPDRAKLALLVAAATSSWATPPRGRSSSGSRAASPNFGPWAFHGAGPRWRA